MPATTDKGGDQKSVATKGWTLAEMVDETRGKLHLKEKDATAFYESSEITKMNAEEYISKLRKVNKRKRVELARCICGDESVICLVFHRRKEELLSMQRYTAEKAMSVMDQKLFEANKRLNVLKYKRNKLRQQLREMKNELDVMAEANASDNDDPRQQKIRHIQNEMDKASIKVSAACNITRRYEAIKDKLQEEVRNYPAILDSLEEHVEQAKVEKEDMIKLMEKGVRASEETRHDLQGLEREMYLAKRSRERQLSQMKKEVDKRKELADKTEKRQKFALMGSDIGDSSKAKSQVEHAERLEKILSLENALERIMKATHVSDIEEIVYRLDHQDETYKQLRHMEKMKIHQKNLVTDELSKLSKEAKEIKFTSKRQMLKGRKAVENMAQYVKSEEKRRNEAVDAYQRDNKLLISLQSGIATILEKLKEVVLKPPYRNYIKGEPIEDLQQCGRKLNLLLTKLGMKDGRASPKYKVESDKLSEYLESKLPPDNIRIKIDLEDVSDESDFHFHDHDQVNEGFKSREDVKRQGQEILNSKLKPKKKKPRKKHN